MSAATSVNNFKQLVQQQMDELVAKCHTWQEILNEKASEIGNNEDVHAVKGQILTTIGQARLLIKERFGQFSGLVDDCKQQCGEKKTTTDDLAGFWDMISMQVDNINNKFGLLESAQKNKWRLPKKTTMGGNRPHMTTTTGSAPKSRESCTQNGNGGGGSEQHKNQQKQDLFCSRRPLLLLAVALMVTVCGSFGMVVAGPIIENSVNAFDNTVAAQHEMKTVVEIPSKRPRTSRMMEEPLEGRSLLEPARAYEFDQKGGCALKPASFAVLSEHGSNYGGFTSMNCNVGVLPQYAQPTLANCSEKASGMAMAAAAAHLCFDPWQRITCETFDKEDKHTQFPKRNLALSIPSSEDSVLSVQIFVDCEADDRPVDRYGSRFVDMNDMKFTFVCESNATIIRGYGCPAFGNYNPKLHLCVAEPSRVLPLYEGRMRKLRADIEYIKSFTNISAIGITKHY